MTRLGAAGVLPRGSRPTAPSPADRSRPERITASSPTRAIGRKERSHGRSAVTLVVVGLLVIFALVVLIRTVRIVPQQTAQIVERLGSYSRTLDDGMHFLVPFVDKVRANIDLREQVVTFPPQPVITSDNLVVSIDTVIYYTVTEAKSAVYEIANFIQGIEQLTVTTLRNVIGSLDLEQTLTSRDQINAQLRGVLDQETGRWGIRVNRVELKAIDPPHSIQDSMEKQMRAERDRRAAILNAEGVKQSAILSAEGEKQSQILRAEGSAQARILEAQGQARAIQQVFGAIHRGKPTQRLLAYQYLQVLPQLARGDSNKMWIIPSEVTDALRGISGALGGNQRGIDEEDETWVDPGPGGRRVRRDLARGPGQGARRGSRPGRAGQRRGHRARDPVAAEQPALQPVPAGADARPTAPAAPTVPTAVDRPADRPGPSRPSGGSGAAALTDTPQGRPATRHRVTGCPCSSLVAVLAAGFAPAPSTRSSGRGASSRSRRCSSSGYPPLTANVSNNIGLVPGGVSGQ